MLNTVDNVVEFKLVNKSQMPIVQNNSINENDIFFHDPLQGLLNELGGSEIEETSNIPQMTVKATDSLETLSSFMDKQIAELAETLNRSHYYLQELETHLRL